MLVSSFNLSQSFNYTPYLFTKNGSNQRYSVSVYGPGAQIESFGRGGGGGDGAVTRPQRTNANEKLTNFRRLQADLNRQTNPEEVKRRKARAEKRARRLHQIQLEIGRKQPLPFYKLPRPYMMEYSLEGQQNTVAITRAVILKNRNEQQKFRNNRKFEIRFSLIRVFFCCLLDDNNYKLDF